MTSQFSYVEKIYLQLSSTMVTSDELVWFKAIVTDVNHLPTQLSGILHVELIDFDERIVDQKLLKLENGIAESFFQLSSAMPSGRYLIRAYTEWNNNFNQDFISQQYIDVYAIGNVLKKDEAISNVTLTETESNQIELSASVYPELINPKFRGKLMLHLVTGTRSDTIEIKKDRQRGYYFNYLLPKNVVKAKMELKLDSVKLRNNNLGFLRTYSKTILINKDFLDVQFFPEGGKLVDGLLSKVAFKVLDYKNEGIVVLGHIVDQFDSIIVPIKTNPLGMGFTNLIAEKDRIYYGVIKSRQGVISKYKLPKVYEKGYVMRTIDTKDYFRTTVYTNFEQKDNLFLKVESRGITYHQVSLNMKENTVDLAFEKESLPEGVIKLTLLDIKKQPIAERLIYNYKQENRLEIKAKTHLKNYSQRDKTIININTKDIEDNALSTNLSVLVLNKEQLGTMHQNRQHILSYFLLSSELKGRIEQPMYYFDSKNEFRYRDLDALMLTQGWRNYIYQDSPEKKIFKIEPETQLLVSGTVGEFFNPKKRPKKPIELTLMAFGKSQQIYAQTVDSTGHFSFYLDDDYTNALEVLIQSKSGKGKKKDYTINIDKKVAPSIDYDKQVKLQLIDSINPYVQKNIERKQAEQAFEIANGTIALKEVKLSNYKLTPEREKMLEQHGPPDVVIEDKELHKKVKKWSFGLFSVLMFNYPDDIKIRRVGKNGGFLVAQAHGADFTFIIIDGIPVRIENYELIGSLPTEEIKSVEIIESPKNPRKYVSEVFGTPLVLEGAFISFINIYTYSKKGLFGVQKTPGLFKSTISAFTPKLEFYGPKHENLEASDWKIPDLRSVVHWAPIVKTDENGNAKIEYYNDDNIGDMLVIIEGITSEGKIGYYEITYSVDEKTER
ncbi:hypothetical protein [Winogradskyella forsetii]|uniref:hypothetical protein n=1 Tax=Winogradskyella forsetii TaxID=2686077 RepID=UPI0015BC5502|nr:hypothetical protein [Winogradskyella forsetii]